MIYYTKSNIFLHLKDYLINEENNYLLLNLIKKYPYKWNYYNLSKNQNIIEEFILKYPYQNWDIGYLIKNNKITDFKVLSKFKYIDKYIIDNYPNKPWDWEWLIENIEINIEKYISLELIKKYLYKWDYYLLSKNQNITEEFILKYPYKGWNIEYLIDNNKITDFNSLSKFKSIDQYIINKYPDKPWDWEWLIENTSIYIKEYIPFDIIEKYSYKWDYWKLSKNPNITEEFILKYLYQNWDIEYLIGNNKITDFKSLSKFKYINQYIIDKYPNKSWNWEWLIQNTNIYIEKYIQLNLIEKYTYKWNYYKLSKNSNLTEEFILKYPYQNWDIYYLINNKITNFKLNKFKNIKQNIDNYSDKLWDWEWLIENTSINIKEYIPLNLIKKYPYKWNYQILNYNPNITEEFILKYPHQNWDIIYLIEYNKIIDFKSLSKFKYINQCIINKYPDKSWDWEWLIENTDINVKKYISLKLLKKYSCKWDYNTLHKNLKITEKFILNHPYQHWDIIKLIRNKKITDFKSLSKFKYMQQNVINKYPSRQWDWEWLIENTDINIVEYYISFNLIEKYSYKWNYYLLSRNLNLTENFILKYPHQNWNIEYLIKINKITDFKSLSKFKYMTNYIIDEYPNNPWDWGWLIENTNINVEKYIPFNLIEKYLYKWDYKYLSYNPNLTEDFILKYLYKNWDIKYLINKFIFKKFLYKFEII